MSNSPYYTRIGPHTNSNRICKHVLNISNRSRSLIQTQSESMMKMGRPMC